MKYKTITSYFSYCVLTVWNYPVQEHLLLIRVYKVYKTCKFFQTVDQADMEKGADAQTLSVFCIYVATFYSKCSKKWFCYISDAIFLNINAQNTIKHQNWVFLITNDDLMWKYLTLNFVEIWDIEKAVRGRISTFSMSGIKQSFNIFVILLFLKGLINIWMPL